MALSRGLASMIAAFSSLWRLLKIRGMLQLNITISIFFLVLILVDGRQQNVIVNAEI
jgi:hypothetical protein